MSITGTWYNELGSQMNITQSEASISGTYITAAGSASGQYTLAGQVNTRPGDGGQAVGWTIVWTNSYGSSHSVTTWSGQYQNNGEQEEIVTFWLLTSEQMPENDWAATNIGQDTFTHAQPTPERIDQARKRRAYSHPRQSAR